jgi:hypothetical protein
MGQTSDEIQRPFGDQSGSVVSFVLGGWVIWRSSVPAGLIVKIAPRVCATLKYRRNAIRPFFPGAVARANPAGSATDAAVATAIKTMKRLTATPFRGQS